MGKKSALVTGATGGIGLAITRRLLSMDYRVLGIGRNFTKTGELGPDFTPVPLDLRDRKALKTALSSIVKQERGSLSLLVNNAGCAYYGIHENLTADEIEEIVDVDLTAPMVITASLLPALRETKGQVINIASVTALESAPHGAAYGAAKAGLLSFTRSLFAEERKQGVRVCAILPDMTDTDLYRNADFAADPAKGCSLSPEDVAEAVAFAVTRTYNTSEIVLQPQYHRIRKKRVDNDQ